MYNLCIIGLGNPSPKYDNSRHNIGKDWIINISKKFFQEFKEKSKLEALIGESHDNKVLWVVPTNYMNDSGKTISKVLRSTNIEIQNCIVVHDDLDLSLGSIRLKEGGGHGGHNGLKDIIEKTGKMTDFVTVFFENLYRIVFLPKFVFVLVNPGLVFSFRQSLHLCFDYCKVSKMVRLVHSRFLIPLLIFQDKL